MGRRVSGHTWTAGRAAVLMCNAQAGNASHVGHRHLWRGINGKLTAYSRRMNTHDTERQMEITGDGEARVEGARGRPGRLQCQGAAPGPGGDAWERAHLHAGHLALLHTFAP